MDKPSWKQDLVRFLEEHRGLIILFFCLPASLIFDFLMQLRNWFFRKILSAPQRHDERVRTIQSQVNIPLLAFCQVCLNWVKNY